MATNCYLDKCYCPGVESTLTFDKVLRDRLHELRRQHTDSWGVYSPPGKILSY